MNTSLKKIFPMVSSDKWTETEDMVNLEYLNNPEILENIKLRFKKEQIYTWVGPTLLVVNPYK